ncbi:MAG: agmatinase [Lentimicrobiaceae bacterium]|nr:agmatinase [Lentimicrobiaceae bacterium]
MKNYGDIPKEFSTYETSKIVILPVPYDGTSTWIKGADKGPAAIIEASANMETYDIDTDSEVYKKGIHTLNPIKERSSPEKMTKAVFEKMKELFKAKKFPVLLGGEHSVSIGAFQAAAASFKDLTILQLDAHADLRDEYLGSKYNHACVMARASELAPIVQVGIRSMSVEESEVVVPDRIFYSEHITEGSNLMFEMLNKLTQNVYITIDLDVLDPSIMPSTGTPEPDGIGYKALLDTIRQVNNKVNIVGFDVVELCPNKYNKAPDFLAAKLIYQILSIKYAK